jgi:hypothetical protein
VDGSNPGGRLPFETGSICKMKNEKIEKKNIHADAKTN